MILWLQCLVLLMVLRSTHPWHLSLTRRYPRSPLLQQQQQYDSYSEQESSNRRKGRTRPTRPSSRIAKKQEESKQIAARRRAALEDPTLLSNVDFTDLQLNPQLQRALPYNKLTEIQAKSFYYILNGDDVVGRARTGTGKTLAYLVPVLERLLGGETLYIPGRNIGALIVAPTRELVTQIADKAEQLLQHTDLTVTSVYGGTRISRDAYLLQRRLPTILVATPGRLQDHLKTTKVKSRKFADIMRETSVVILDETDRLLDLGFRKDIQSILSYCARPEKRQLLLFSATISPSRTVQSLLGGQSFEFVDCCIDKNDKDEPCKKQQQQKRRDTNVRVQQSYVVLPIMDRYLSGLVEILLLQQQQHDNANKIVVFLPTARAVSFLTQFLRQIMPPSLQIYEMHSRKTQSARNKASSEFGKCPKGILLTTNVSARGIDYPDVTLVIQYGAPDSKENYIHRLGRTGRAGRRGQGLLVLMPFETNFLNRRKDLVQNDELSKMLNAPASSEFLSMLEPTRRRIASGDIKLTAGAQGAYRAFLAYYVEHKDQWDLEPRDIVRYANDFAQCTGLIKTPPLSEKNAAKLGLLGIPGLVVGDD